MFQTHFILSLPFKMCFDKKNKYWIFKYYFDTFVYIKETIFTFVAFFSLMFFDLIAAFMDPYLNDIDKNISS